MPPIPHIAVAGEVTEPEAPQLPIKPPFWKKKAFIYGSAGLAVVLLVAAYFAWRAFTSTASDPVPDKKAPKAGAPKAAPAPKATPPAPAPAGGKSPDGPNKATQTPGLSPTQSEIAHAPGTAVKKAQDAVTTRRANEQTRIDNLVAGEDPAATKAATTPYKAAEKTGPTSVNVSTQLAPGVAAPVTEIQATTEASTAFRAFINNARIGGLFQGATPRVLINGRTLRAGETVDATLGIVFDGYDAEKKQLLFKDKTGAIVTRRYP